MSDPDVLYWRIGDLAYPRNSRIRAFLGHRGYTVDAHVRAQGPLRRRVFDDLRQLVRRSRTARVVVVAEISLDFVVAAWIVTRMRGIPLVVDGFIGKHETLVDDHGLYARRSPGALLCRLVDAAAITLADLYLVDTEARRMRLAARHSRARMVSLPVGAPAEFDGPTARVVRPAGDSGDLRVMFYGSYLPLHGVETIVSALAEAGRSDIRLTMVGTPVHGRGPADTARLAEELGVADRVTFLPNMPLAEIAATAADHDVVLGLFGGSDKAGAVIANKVWQGLAAGRAVVTRDGSGVDEIRDIVGRQLITVPPRDPVALGAVLRELAERHPPIFPGTAAVLAAYVDARFAGFGMRFGALVGKVPATA